MNILYYNVKIAFQYQIFIADLRVHFVLLTYISADGDKSIRRSNLNSTHTYIYHAIVQKDKPLTNSSANRGFQLLL